ncbi:hypothetical protein [Bacillus sp. FJAT-45350]|uniref:hypothetical protein n=1 Tax=Bacillus sp. FJAT-45350 TaxID=2011014 RepID=UPI000BB986CD|nr:hypothetical protein [Bacillus sp. FJAT-45350]
MLKVNITYISAEEAITYLESIATKVENDTYIIPLHPKGDFTVTNYKKEQMFTIIFSNELEFEQLEQINLVIQQIGAHCKNGLIDDSKAFVGYLDDGESAYIIKRFGEWRRFILEAKHKSMEGQKVAVYDNQNELGTGLLLGYSLKEGIDFNVHKVTLLTASGEQTYDGTHLTVKTTGEYF